LKLKERKCEWWLPLFKSEKKYVWKRKTSTLLSFLCEYGSDLSYCCCLRANPNGEEGLWYGFVLVIIVLLLNPELFVYCFRIRAKKWCVCGSVLKERKERKLLEKKKFLLMN